MLKVTVLYNLPEKGDASDLDTQKSAMSVVEGLKKNYDVKIFGINKDDINDLKNLKTDFVFNLVEWAGKESELGVKVIEELEKTGFPYSGSDAKGYYLSCMKNIMKEEMDKQSILTPKWFVVERLDNFPVFQLRFPVILKPVAEHCGIGIGQDSVALDDEELKVKVGKMLGKYQEPVLVEEFIDGRELHVTVLEKDGQPWVLPPAEVVFEKKAGWKPILSYEGKWDEKSAEYKMSHMELAGLNLKVKDQILNTADECYRKLGGRDYPRIDMRIRGVEVFVLEINNNPGIDYDIESGIGMSARAVGLSWEDLLRHIVENARRRWIS